MTSPLPPSLRPMMPSRAPLRWIRRALLAFPLLGGCVEASSPEFSTIRVIVVTPLGRAVPNARVELRGGWNYPDVRGVEYTDRYGNAYFRLPGSSYELTVLAPDSNWVPQRAVPRDAGLGDGELIVREVILTPLTPEAPGE